MDAKLYVIPGSHPSMTARRMLEQKGIPYKRRDLVSGLHKRILKALRFPGDTVPALVIDGRRVQGSREIARELERVRPDPPLFPSDPEQRKAVEEAERWGDEVLQDIPRRLSWAILKRDRSGVRSFLEEAKLGIPTSVAAMTSGPLISWAARYNDATDEAVRADLAALPGVLDKIDGWIAEGVLGSEPPNAADFQIASSVRLMLCSEDLRPAIEGRPAAELAIRVVPDFPGSLPPALPAEWLAPLRSREPAPAG